MLTCASLFAGCGGWEAGAVGHGFRPLWAIEFNPVRAAVHDANFPGAHTLVEDVRKVRPSSLPAPDLLFVSPPCQEASQARRHSLPPRADADVGIVTLDFVDQLRPETVLLENTPAYQSQPVFPAIAAGLRELGYHVAWEVVQVSHLGAATRRRRLLLRAVRAGRNLHPFPVGPEPGWYGAVRDLVAVAPPAKPLAPWQARAMEELPPDGYPALIVGGNPTHRTIDGKYLRKVWYGPDEPAPTLVPGSENARSMAGHRILMSPGGAPRRFTAAMAARLSGFPDWFKWPADEKLAVVVIGNAVPPPLSSAAIRSTGLGLLFAA